MNNLILEELIIERKRLIETRNELERMADICNLIDDCVNCPFGTSPQTCEFSALRDIYDKRVDKNNSYFC